MDIHMKLGSKLSIPSWCNTHSSCSPALVYATMKISFISVISIHIIVVSVKVVDNVIVDIVVDIYVYVEDIIIVGIVIIVFVE